MSLLKIAFVHTYLHSWGWGFVSGCFGKPAIVWACVFGFEHGYFVNRVVLPFVFVDRLELLEIDINCIQYIFGLYCYQSYLVVENG